MRSVFILIACVWCAVFCKAQDPHFSQFFASPLTLNPAFTGKFDGQFRAAGNYRNQWPTINRAYQTATVSVDFPILQSRIGSTDTWGVGLMGYTDKNADGAVSFNYASISTAYHKGLDEDGFNQLGLGFQATYADMMVNISKLKFEDQLTPLGFTGVTSEVFNNSTLKNHYWDVNAGILYTTSTTDKNNFYLGVSMYHINRPKQQFTGALYLLEPRTTFHGGAYFPVGETTTFHLSALHTMQREAHETVFGGAVQFGAGNDINSNVPVSVYVGSWYRFQDALIPYVGLEFGSYRLGMTYDINVSDLKTASNSRGGVEISLIYIKKPAESRGLPCPKF